MLRPGLLPFSLRLLFLTAILWTGELYGLDPDKAITQYVHRIWPSEEGSVRAFAQTADGYLLLGGQAGLMRFDGLRFSAVNGDWVRNILEDEHGRLWIGTNYSGLVRIDHGVSRRFTTADGLPSDHITCLVSGRSGVVWVCTLEGLVEFSQDKIHVYQTHEGLPVNGLLSACQAPDGTLWMGANAPLVTSWNGSSFRSIALPLLPANVSIRSLACSSDGSLWVGSSEGLLKVKDSHQQQWTTKDGLVDNRIFALHQSADGTMWIGTHDGFSRLHNGHFENFRSGDGLSQTNVYSIFEDHEGNIWVGTKRGVDQFLDGPETLYTVKDGLPTNNVGPVLVDGNDQVWIGTLDGGLSHFDGSKFSRVTRPHRSASNIVYSLAQDIDRNLWVGTNRGVERLRDGRVVQTFTTRQGLPSDRVHALLRDRSGAIWAGTDAGPAKLVGGRFVQPVALRKALNAPITAIGEDLSGRIFFSTEQGGVYSFAKGKVDEILYDGAPILDADAFYTDADGCVWIGTIGNGLSLLDHGKVFVYAMRDGLYDNEIFGIVGDSQDRLWFTCVKGLYSVNRADLRRFAAGELKHFASSPYNSMDSLNAIEGKSGSQPAILRTHDGRIWFSANRGLVAFDPNRHPRESSVPPVAIEQVSVNGQISDAGALEKLPPGEKNLEFRYTGINFTPPAHMTFHYKLEGYDKDWIDAGSRREAYYTKLPPGQFRFRVTACTAEGICNTDGARVDFGLAYRYYQRSWFLPGCVSLVALAIWLLYKLRVRQLRERFSLVLAERSRIARELHDTLIQGLSGLTMQVQALTDRPRFAEDQDALEEIIRDAAACMQETRQSVVGLRSVQQSRSGLATAICTAAKQLTKETDIRLKLELDAKPRSLPADVEYNLLYIAREAVSNSVRHSGARTIKVVLSWVDEQLQLVIRDDGRGFDRQHIEDRFVGHYGLIGMKERAALIGADFDLESRSGHGTVISIFLPGIKSEREWSHHLKEESTR